MLSGRAEERIARMHEYSWLIASWPLAALIVLFISREAPHRSVGLPLAYFTGLAVIHLLGALLYLLPNYRYHLPYIIHSGFRETTVALYAFCAGLAAVKFIPSADVLDKKHFTATRHVFDNNLPLFYTAFGLTAYLVGLPLFGRLPTFAALISGCTQASVIGVCLGIFTAIQRRDRKHFYLWSATAILFPMLTLLNAGFVGFGIFSLISVTAFALFLIRIRAATILMLLCAVFLGLSFYVTYMRDRGNIRELMWYQENTVIDRVSVVYDMLRNFELFDIYNRKHLYLIDIRLNQNHLIGSAIRYLGSDPNNYAHGRTIVGAFIALVPRVIWSNKPVVAGGSELVSKYTGMRFDRNTSVGAGQVFEFYVNFGRQGVVVGFIILGILIGFFDNKASARLLRNDFKGFVLWYLPGLGFLQSGGNLIEIVTTVGAGIGSALLVTNIAQRYQRRHSQRDKRQTRPFSAGKSSGRASLGIPNHPASEQPDGTERRMQIQHDKI